MGVYPTDYNSEPERDRIVSHGAELAQASSFFFWVRGFLCFVCLGFGLPRRSSDVVTNLGLKIWWWGKAFWPS